MNGRIFATATASERSRPRRRQPLGRYRYVRLRWRVLFAIIDALGMVIWGLRRFVAVTRSVAAARPPRRILLVQLDHLGDAVISTALLQGLRKRFPRARIEVLCGPWNREFFTACREVDRIHVMRSNRLSRSGCGCWPIAIVWWGWRLRRRQFDLAIDPRGEFPAAVILWLCGASRRLGFACGGGGFLLTDVVAYVPGRHEVESRQALLQKTDGVADEDAIPRFDPGSAARGDIADRLRSVHAAGVPLLVLHVGAGTAAKRWPAEHWRELIGRLIVEHARIVLVGLEADRGTAHEILEDQGWPQVWDWTGRLGLVELGALIEAADVFIGADSGPAHLASAVGTPAVAIFSGTNRAEQWRPWGDRVTVVRHPVPCSPCHRESCYWHDHPCMMQLSAAAVYSAALPYLSDNPQPSTLNPQPLHDRSRSHTVAPH
jgi:ADP-heptose:LPS heptosyltransferase